MKMIFVKFIINKIKEELFVPLLSTSTSIQEAYWDLIIYNICVFLLFFLRWNPIDSAFIFG